MWEYKEATSDTIRLYKTHSRLEFLPCKHLPRKMIVVQRSPKDNIVSFYHHMRNADYGKFTGDFNTFFAMWVAGRMVSNCYFAFYRK